MYVHFLADQRILGNPHPFGFRTNILPDPAQLEARQRFSTSTLFSSSKMMADPTDYKALFLRAEEERRHEAELRRQAEQRERQERERNQQTTFEEFIQHCHDLLSRPLRAEKPSRSTTGKIPAPTGKHCPL